MAADWQSDPWKRLYTHPGVTEDEVRKISEAVLALATKQPCGKKARVSKYGMPYTLICGLWKGHITTRCEDGDNGIWFDPDAEVRDGR